MNTGGVFNVMRRLRIVILLLALLLAYGAVNYAPRAETSLPIVSVGLGGITGTANNTALAYGRYVLVAPFWPSKGVAENGDLELTELDNSFIYVIDTKKPNTEPLKKELASFDSTQGLSKTVYFPSRLLFDPQSNYVYVRGTRFEEMDGLVSPVDVIAYVHVNLDDNGKPVFDSSVVSIDIQGVSSPFTGEAPLDFGFGQNGNLMVFTNGASVFSYNLVQGYLYGVGIVPESEYGPDDSISFLDVDATTNVVTVCWNRKSVNDKNVASISSEVSFYRLAEDGTFEILKRVYSDQFPDGSALANGSNVTVATDDGEAAFALFATNDGSLCSVDLRSDGVQAAVKRMYHFPELARTSDSDTSPLVIQYDSSKRTIGIVKPGFEVQISRPSNGRKKGRISRPSNLHINSVPVLAMARLNKKNRVVSASSFTDFGGDVGLSNFVNGDDSQWLISTYSGNLYSVDVAPELSESGLTKVGQVGSRVERIDYYSKRANVVAINSFALEEDGMQIAAPGSLVVGNMSDGGQLSSVSLQALMPTASVLGSRSAPSIRRPCNIKR